MKKYYNYLKKAILAFGLFLSITTNAQHFTVTLDNFTSTANTFEVDLMLIIEQPTQGVRLSSLTAGINYNPDILNGGSPCTTIDCGSWEYIPGSRSAQLSTLNITHTTNRANPIGQLRIVQTHALPVPTSSNPGQAVDLLPGTYNMGRYRFTNTVSWAPDSDPQLWLSPNNLNDSTNTIVLFYPYGGVNFINAYTTTFPEVPGGGVTLGYTATNPMSRILNPALGTPENQISQFQAIPNPFSSTFQIYFEPVSDETVSIRIYDMTGRTIEAHTVESNAFNTLQLGHYYPFGIYNVMVSQNEKTQNVRVVKR